MVEAYVGAMFIDSDFDFGVVQKFFDEHVRWFFEDMHVYDTFANNHPIVGLTPSQVPDPANWFLEPTTRALVHIHGMPRICLESEGSRVRR